MELRPYDVGANPADAVQTYPGKTQRLFHKKLSRLALFYSRRHRNIVEELHFTGSIRGAGTLA